MKTDLLVPYCLGLAMLIGASLHGGPKETAPVEAQLIFQSGFEGDSRIVALNSAEEDADIIGTDGSLPDHNDWVKDLEQHPNIGSFNLQYQGGDVSRRFAKIIQEPGNPSNRVLQFWLDQPNVASSAGPYRKGRIQANLYGGTNGLREFSQSVRIFLHPDFNTVRSYPDKISWLTIAEFWNNLNWDKAVPYGFRVSLNIAKPGPAAGDLYFEITGQDTTYGGEMKTVWSTMNEKVPVPIGKWFTMDYYYKEGDADNGRFYLAITPEGEKKAVVFDLTKVTHNTQDPKPDGVTEFCPMKLYTSRQLINYMKENGKTLQIYWDDFKLWTGKKTD